MISLEKFIFWLLFVVAIGLSLNRMRFLYRTIKVGRRKRKEDYENIGKRTKILLSYVVGQWCNIRNITWKDLAGLEHFFIFWGFILLAIYYLVFLFIGDGFGVEEPIQKFTFTHYFLYLIEIVSVLILIGITCAALRRVLIKPARLGPDFEISTFLVITFFVYVLVLCNFALDGCRLNLGISTFYTPVAVVFSSFFNRILELSTQWKLFSIIWWVRYVILLGFLVYIPYSHHQHPLFCPFNIFFRSFRSSGALVPVNLGEERLGVSEVEDFSWKELLESYACTQCGRCQNSCPAYMTGKPLSPKLLFVNINEHLKGYARRKENKQEQNVNIFGLPAVKNEGILSCTTCGACIEVCPVFNRGMDIIVELRRNLVYEGKFDPGHQSVLQRTFDYGNPHGVPPLSRDSVLNVLGIDKARENEKYDALYWLGCSVYFDERSQDISRAMVSIFKKSGLRIAAFGAKEQCCGDFVRRIGDEGLFQKLVKKNIETISKFQANLVITHCPHCFNTFKNEYPNYGANFKVIHHSEFIFNLLKVVNIEILKIEKEVAYHDPCYLGRHNKIYDFPREVVKAISEELVEFPMSRNKSFCCGAGGGHMWKHEEIGKRISDARIEQALEKGVKTVVTACPFCLLMFEDALLIKGLADKVKIRDIAELVNQSLS